MADRTSEAWKIFVHAVSLPSPLERASFLELACVGKPDLLAAVRFQTLNPSRSYRSISDTT
jgi:hypothetical protein